MDRALGRLSGEIGGFVTDPDRHTRTSFLACTDANRRRLNYARATGSARVFTAGAASGPKPLRRPASPPYRSTGTSGHGTRSEEQTSELQSRFDLVCRL